MPQTPSASSTPFQPLNTIPKPTAWPRINERLLGSHPGQPISPLDRLSLFSPDDFERFILEWAQYYLTQKFSIDQIQWRGGAGDKGRDIIVWQDPSHVTPRRWLLYQCKHYNQPLSFGNGAGEIAKVLYYCFTKEYTVPEKYWFVTHKGLTNSFQDQLDDPNELRNAIIDKWPSACANRITSKYPVKLDKNLRDYITNFDFSIFKAKQPHELIEEHKHTPMHTAIFGGPLIKRPKPPTPPSQVKPTESGYITQLYQVIAKEIGLLLIISKEDFVKNSKMKKFYDRSRISFYSAEGLKELARDHMASEKDFDTLLVTFEDGLYHFYTDTETNGLKRLQETMKGAQALDLGNQILYNYIVPLDREGLCHHLANDKRITWCE